MLAISCWGGSDNSDFNHLFPILNWSKKIEAAIFTMQVMLLVNFFSRISFNYYKTKYGFFPLNLDIQVNFSTNLWKTTR